MKKVLDISDYANDIHLHDEFLFNSLESENKENIVDSLLLELNVQHSLLLSYSDKRKMLRGKLNTLHPNTLNSNAISKLNMLLQIELQDKTICDVRSEFVSSALQPGTEEQDNKLNYFHESVKNIGKTKLVVWHGDITTLKIDAIVNAANNQMLGCFQPLHACIDNVIHSAAGVQLRDDCHIIMQKQGFAEPTGTAKITRAYNLPSKYIIHTVGPIVRKQVSDQNITDLINTYTSCLEVCKQMNTIKSIAFCSISTGVFGYPANEAAKVAFSTVCNWLMNNCDCLDVVVFNVFSDNDRKLYEALINEL